MYRAHRAFGPHPCDSNDRGGSRGIMHAPSLAAIPSIMSSHSPRCTLHTLGVVPLVSEHRQRHDGHAVVHSLVEAVLTTVCHEQPCVGVACVVGGGTLIV